MTRTNLQLIPYLWPILACSYVGINFANWKSFDNHSMPTIEQMQPVPKGLSTIVIDAGHGGKDPGCSGESTIEKKVVLDIAKKLSKKIKTNYPSVKVILTRDTDVFIPLYERAAIANRNHADLFISIHCNAMPPNNENTRGTETYVMGLHTANHNLEVAKRENAAILLEADYEKNYDYDPNSPEGHIMLSMYQNAFLEQSILMADNVERQFKNKDQRKSRGVKQAGFVVLKDTTMPSILVETGFLTNKADEAYLLSDKGQNETVNSIYEAFVSYKIEIEDGLTLPTPPLTVIKKEEKTTPTQPAVVFTPTTQEKTTKGASALPYPDIVKKTPNRSTLTRKSPTPKKATKVKSVTSDMPVVAPIERPDPTQDASILFKVQMAVTSKPVNTNVAPWNQQTYLIEVMKEGNVYKYQARNFENYHQAQKAKNHLRQNGFPDAFIVAYQNGTRISINEAKRILGLL